MSFKVYISGPMTGLPDFNFPAFDDAACRLRHLGIEVVSPAELCVDTTKPWQECMREDIKALVDCDAVLVLPGWDKSRGASLEVFIATQLGLRVINDPRELLGVTLKTVENPRFA